jgi:hypothetical protein
MTDKQKSPGLTLLLAIILWLGSAVSAYRIFTQSRKPEGDLVDAILMTVLFTCFAIASTNSYRKTRQE